MASFKPKAGLMRRLATSSKAKRCWSVAGCLHEGIFVAMFASRICRDFVEKHDFHSQSGSGLLNFLCEAGVNQVRTLWYHVRSYRDVFNFIKIVKWACRENNTNDFSKHEEKISKRQFSGKIIYKPLTATDNKRKRPRLLCYCNWKSNLNKFKKVFTI